MSSTLSSIRSSPIIPDLTYDSFRNTLLRGQESQQQQQQQHGEDGSENGNGMSLLRSRAAAGHKGRPPTAAAAAAAPPTFTSKDGKSYPLQSYEGESIAFWLIFCILCILVLANAILTFVILGVLRVRFGMESIEYLPGLLKFSGETDLDEVFLREGIVQGFAEQPIEILGEDGGSVKFSLQTATPTSFSIEKSAININSSEFIMRDGGLVVFSTNTPSLGLPLGVQKLDVRVAQVNRVTAPFNATLSLHSTTQAFLRGSEGTYMEAKGITFKADQDIQLKSVNGSIRLGAREGIYMNVNDLPLVREGVVTRKSHSYTTHGKKESQYQLCICMPSGLLFRVEVPLDNLGRKEGARVGCHSGSNTQCLGK